MIKRIFVAQTVAAMQIADVGQFDDQPRRAIVRLPPARFQLCFTVDKHQIILSCESKNSLACLLFSRSAPARSSNPSACRANPPKTSKCACAVGSFGRI